MVGDVFVAQEKKRKAHRCRVKGGPSCRSKHASRSPAACAPATRSPMERLTPSHPAAASTPPWRSGMVTVIPAACNAFCRAICNEDCWTNSPDNWFSYLVNRLNLLIKGNRIPARFKAIYDKATVKGYSPSEFSKLGLKKNLLPDGSKNEDGSFTFNDLTSLRTGSPAKFIVSFDGDVYSGEYRGLAVIKANKKSGLQKLAATGFTQLIRNDRVVFSIKEPTDVFIEKANGKVKIIIADKAKAQVPLIDKL